MHFQYLSAETAAGAGISRTLRSDDGSVGGVELEAFVLLHVGQARRRARLGQALLAAAVVSGGNCEKRVLRMDDSFIESTGIGFVFLFLGVFCKLIIGCPDVLTFLQYSIF